MNLDIDLHCSAGSVSSMPGSSHPFPEGSICDQHRDRLAVRRIQGETDSFGCEYILVCQECLEIYLAYQQSEEARTGVCDWCRKSATDLRDTRDYDEGMAGPLYRVCCECRTRQSEAAARELEENGSLMEDPIWDDDEDDDGDLDDEPVFDTLGNVAPYSQRLYFLRYYGTKDEYVRNRTGGTAEWYGRGAVEKFLRQHNHQLRGRRVVLYPVF